MSSNTISYGEGAQRVQRTAYSALWAAWADALGFISELTNEEGLRRRIGSARLTTPIAWRRRVGGRFGAEALLQAGSYSDDTQLRLATGRSISSRGFDVEAFATVELGVWPCYALGAGNSSRSAAANIGRPGSAWYANFYKGWTRAGGNGAAMRIQPHVWAEPDPINNTEHLAGLLRNAVTTHGDPIAIFGSIIHADALAISLVERVAPNEEYWPSLQSKAREALDLVRDDINLTTIWVPAWERDRGESFAECWNSTAMTCREMMASVVGATRELREFAAAADQSATSKSYNRILRRLGLLDPRTRGSGLGTVVAALCLVAAFPGDPGGAAVTAANALGSDTDSIATIAAGIIGASDDGGFPPPSHVLDQDYIVTEAVRIGAIAMGGSGSSSFAYPDLLHWEYPRSQVDCVGIVDNQIALSGIAWLESADLSEQTFPTSEAAWSWYSSDLGQSFLAKHRQNLRVLPKSNRPSRIEELSQADTDLGQFEVVSQSPVLVDDNPDVSGESRLSSPAFERRISNTSIDDMLDWISVRGFKHEDIGYAFHRLALIGSTEQVIAFASALRERLRT